MRRAVIVVAALGVALVAAATVLAQSADREKIARTAAGNARAKAEVLRRADLGKGWAGGFKKPDLSSTLPCSYRPKQSDLVLVGAAETTWERPIAYEIDSEAQVLRKAAMVSRDWQRTVVAPQVLPCLRQTLKKSLGSKGKDLSVRRVAFPRLTARTRAFRLRAKVTNGDQTVPIDSYFVAMAHGRDEISLTLTAFGAGTATLHADALRLARVLAHRLRS